MLNHISFCLHVYVQCMYMYIYMYIHVHVLTVFESEASHFVTSDLSRPKKSMTYVSLMMGVCQLPKISCDSEGMGGGGGRGEESGERREGRVGGGEGGEEREREDGRAGGEWGEWVTKVVSV